MPKAVLHSKELEAELKKIMPGYKWVVHQHDSDERLVATGSQSSGFNRLSTLCVTRTERDGKKPTYSAKSAGYGLKAKWEHESEGGTLAQALRRLQDHYEAVAATNSSLASSLARGRISSDGQEGGDE